MSNSLLWKSVEDNHCQTIAVMGMAKNTGKTVVLNHLLEEAHRHSIPVGITSIGRDGESHDQVFRNPKPLIHVPVGTLIATARDTLNRSRITWEKIQETEIDTPMGKIWIVKAKEAGDLEVAGANRSSEQKENMRLLRQLGSQMIFLDGALGRSHHASPALADGVILATGAALGGGMKDVLRKTQERLEVLTLSKIQEPENTMIRDILKEEPVVIWNRSKERIPLHARATLTAAKELSQVKEPVGMIGLAGAVGRLIWEEILHLAEKNSGMVVVIADGTRLFIERKDILQLERLGGNMMVLDPICILGVSLNPTTPFGKGYDPEEFLEVARENLKFYPIVDVILEKI